MKKKVFRVLVFQDPNVTGLMVGRLLAQHQDPAFEVVHADSLAGGMHMLKTASAQDDPGDAFDIVVLDLAMLGDSQWTVIREIRGLYPGTAVLVLGRENQPDVEIKALREGAQDFIPTERLWGNLLVETVLYSIERVEGGSAMAEVSEPVPGMELTWIIKDKLARARGPHLGAPETIRRSVDVWIAEAKDYGIKSVLCLLETAELQIFYGNMPGGLLSYYEHHGFSVGHVSVPDFCLPPLKPRQLRRVRKLYEALPKPVVVHCRHGVARSGHAVGDIRKRVLRKDEDR